MADYVDGDEQLQDAFEEGNGDANNDEARGRWVSSTIAGRHVRCSQSLHYMLCSGACIYASQTGATRGREEEDGGAHCTSQPGMDFALAQ